MNNSISRRTLLRGMGAAISLPWFESMATAGPAIVSSAASSVVSADGPPVRMAFLYVPNGMNMADWKPRGPDDRKFEIPKILEPVERHRDVMNVISGLSLEGAFSHGDGGGDHARSVAAFLTGAHPKKTHGSNIRNGESVDQLAAQKIGHLTKLPSLELGTEPSSPAGRCDSGYSCLYTSNISWRTPTSPMAKEVDPEAVFSRMFGSSNRLENRIMAGKRAANRSSILDFVLNEAKQLNQKLGTSDRRKLEEYLYAVRDIERRIASVDKLGKTEEDIPDFPRPAGVPAEYGEHIKLMFDMMTLAFQTDSTRVISFMFANAGSNRSYRNLGISDGHHNISHHGGAFAKQKQISKINTYHAGLLGHLLDRLRNIKEGNGTLLDNCMVVYGSGIADGNSHNHRDLPIAMFGGGGGSIDTGRHIQVRSRTPLTNLYCSMLDRVGAGVENFSDSNGRIDQLKV